MRGREGTRKGGNGKWKGHDLERNRSKSHGKREHAFVSYFHPPLLVTLKALQSINVYILLIDYPLFVTLQACHKSSLIWS